jgi:hypothetical protein
MIQVMSMNHIQKGEFTTFDRMTKMPIIFAPSLLYLNVTTQIDFSVSIFNRSSVVSYSNLGYIGKK